MPGVLNLPTNISLEPKSSGDKASMHGPSEAHSANQPDTAFSSVMNEVAPDDEHRDRQTVARGWGGDGRV